MNLSEQEKEELLKCKDCNINNFSYSKTSMRTRIVLIL